MTRLSRALLQLAGEELLGALQPGPGLRPRPQLPRQVIEKVLQRSKIFSQELFRCPSPAAH